MNLYFYLQGNLILVETHVPIEGGFITLVIIVPPQFKGCMFLHLPIFSDLLYYSAYHWDFFSMLCYPAGGWQRISVLYRKL